MSAPTRRREPEAQRIPSNPLSGLDTLPDIPKPKRRYLSHNEIDLLAKGMAALTTAHGKLRSKRLKRSRWRRSQNACGTNAERPGIAGPFSCSACVHRPLELRSDRISVELATAYLNPSPQVSAHANRLPDLFNRPARNPDPCPTTEQPKPRSSNGKPWALDSRLTGADRAAIVSEYQAGALQRTLAEKYGISLSSVKRLAREAREETRNGSCCPASTR